jgi:glutamate 5-kinase
MQKYKRIVVKVGTKVMTASDRSLDLGMISALASQISSAMDSGVEVILVTSGAIGAGMSLLNIKKRPSDLSYLQATAAIGQSHLMHLYSGCFRSRDYNIGQILLTQEDFNDRARFLNIKNTINTLLRHKAIPVINENDTVATDEIRCGDNDRLSSLVADLSGADLLVLLSDVEGLLDENGKIIKFVADINHKITRLGGKSHCDLGTGGMATKLEAARIAVKAGIACVIANGREADVLKKVLEGGNPGTVFGTASVSAGDGKSAKKRWIAYSSRSKGRISVDDGAGSAIKKSDKSLLASGITSVSGRFDVGDTVSITDKDGIEVAKGISNYNSEDLKKIRGLKTPEFIRILGRSGRTSDEVVHKDNLVVL